MKSFLHFLVLMTLLCVGHALVKAAPPSELEYDLNVKVVPDARRLEATGTVWLPAESASRQSLTLVLSDVMRDFQVEVLEPSRSAGPARVENPGAARRQVRWQIYPARPIPAGSPVRLRFSYAGGERAAFVFSLGPVCSFASGINTSWYPQVDGENDRGTGTLRVSVPSGYSVVATGKEVGTPSDRAAGNFQFKLNQKSYLSFAAAKYMVLRRKGRVPTTAYLLSPRPNIEDYLSGSTKILDFLTEQFGPYPSEDFAIVEVPTAQANEADFQGASIKGFILVSSGFLNQKFSLPYFAHEIGHQWWGNLVLRTGTRGRAMLDEAMTQHGALLTVEAFQGGVAAEQFRRKGFGGGAVEYFKMAAAGLDHSLDELPREIQQPLGYTKGMLVLDMLSRQIGRDRFRRVLQRITREYAARFITWDDFLRLVQQEQREDLRWFFTQWFERPGAPNWNLVWTQKGTVLHGTITQLPPYYRATIELEAEGTNYQRFFRIVTVRGPRTEFSWPVQFQVHSLTLDPHFKVLHWTPEYRADASAAAPYVRADKLRESGKLDEAEKQFRAALQKVTEPDLHGERFLLEYGLARVLFENQKPQEAKQHLQAALDSPSRRAETLPWVYFGFAMYAKAANDEELLKWALAAMTTANAAAGNNPEVIEAARQRGLIK